MSPSQLSWTQGFFFFFLGLVVPGIWHCACKRRTRQGTSDVQLSSIQIGDDTGTSPLDACGGDDEGGRPPSNQATVVFKALPSQPDRTTTFRPDRRRVRRSTVKQLKREQANIAADSTSTRAWMFSTPPVLQRQPPDLVPGPSPQLEESIIPQMEETIPQLEDQAKTFEGLRHRPNTLTQRIARAPNWIIEDALFKDEKKKRESTVKRLKREQANIAADSTSTPAWMFSTPPVLQQQPPDLVPGPSPHLEENIPQLEDQAKTFEGLRHRPNTSTQRIARAPNWIVEKNWERLTNALKTTGSD